VSNTCVTEHPVYTDFGDLVPFVTQLVGQIEY
jgi:hypothetical protein